MRYRLIILPSSRRVAPFVVFSIASYLNFDHGFLSEQAARNKRAVKEMLR